MNKYISSENSTIEIFLNNQNDYTYISSLMFDISQLNFKRLLVNINHLNSWDYNKVKNIVSMTLDESFDVYFRLSFSEELMEGSIDIYNNIIVKIDIENIDEVLIKKYPGCYFEVNYNYDNIDKIIKLIQYYSDRIILNPEIDLTNIDDYNKTVVCLFEKSAGLELLFSPILIPKTHITEHPCIVFLCSGDKCHSGHKNIPRHISIDCQKNVYFYSYSNNIIGHLGDNNLLDFMNDLKNNPKYLRFIEASLNLYFDIYDKYFINIVPWFAYLEKYL